MKLWQRSTLIPTQVQPQAWKEARMSLNKAWQPQALKVCQVEVEANKVHEVEAD